MPNIHSPEFKARAVRMVQEHVNVQGGSRAAAIRTLAPQLGCSESALIKWCQAANRHQRSLQADPSEDKDAKIRRLERELAEAKKVNELLKLASAFSRRNSAVPAVDGRFY